MDSPFPLVLVVEDDPVIRKTLVINLEAEGYRILSAATGEEALRRIAGRVPRLAIVDLLLPDMHGLELCRRLKAVVDVPIIVLTAIATDDMVVQALDQCADDYVVKPFSFRALAARIRRVLMRTPGMVPPQRIETPAGELVLDPSGRRATIDGKQVRLTTTEARMLSYLAANANHILSTERLIDRVWPDGDGDENRLWVYIRRLRQKLEPEPNDPRVLVTIRSIGYVLRGAAG